MSNPVASFSGLASGIEWRDIVDQLVAVERSRTVAPIEQQMDQRQAQRDAWTKLSSLLETMNDAARVLRAGGIGGFTASVAASATTSRTLLTATAGTGAAPGSYKVEVMQLAQAAKISGNAISDTSAPLGVGGDLTVAGATISVGAGDSLAAIRDKINAANSGANPTGVSATIISDGGTAGRLVLTRTTTGAQGIDIAEDGSGIARELGFLDTRSRHVPSMVANIASALGIQVSPPPASIRVNGKLITVDLESESLASVAAKINAAGGQAKVVEEVYGNESRYRLQIQGNVQAVQGDADSEAVVAALGFAAGGMSAVQQTVSTAAFTGSGDETATLSTALAGIKTGGVSAGLAVGDAINIRGTRGDGTAVSIGFVVQPGDTMQTLIDRINDPATGFGAGTRGATASLGSDGVIHLTDDTGGESRLSLSIGIAREDGSSGNLAVATTTTQGRTRELAVGQDAMVAVDGVVVTRSSNTMSGIIPGVSLSLLSAEPGSTVDLTVGHDTEAGVTAVKAFADAYNSIVKFFDEQRATGQPLSGNSTLRGIVSGLTDGLRTEVASNATYSRLTLMGLSLDRTGLLMMDSSAVRKALSENPGEVEALFGFDGAGQALVAATDNATRFGTGSVSLQLRSIDDGKIRLESKKAEAERRLEIRKAALIDQYVRMETALSALTSQGSFLTQQINSFQSQR